MPERVFVSIIIPVYNNAPSLRKAVESLCDQTYPGDKYEIIVVDDESKDDTAQCIEELKRRCPRALRYCFQEHKGPAAARNLGIRHARGDIVAFVDSDCIPAHNWIEEITRLHDNGGVAGIGGTIQAAPTALRVSRYCAHIRMNERPPIDQTGVTRVITGNASFMKSAVRRAGGFDERYNFPGGEESDLCDRLKRCGYSFRFNRDAVVYNRHKQSLGGLVRTYFNYGKGDSFLALRKISQWEIPARALLLLVKNCSLAIKFFKIPFKGLVYYSQGTGFQDGVAYAFFDYARQSAFLAGSFAGYGLGVSRGFCRNGRERIFL